MNQFFTMPRDEAQRRVAALSLEITKLVASSGELVDLSLQALLSTYLAVAEQTGRMHETPCVLSNVADALAKSLITPQTAKH